MGRGVSNKGRLSQARRETTATMLLRRSSGLNGPGLFQTSRVVPPGCTPAAFLAVRISSSRVLVILRRQRFERFLFSTLFVFSFELDDSRNPRAARTVPKAIPFFCPRSEARGDAIMRIALVAMAIFSINIASYWILRVAAERSRQSRPRARFDPSQEDVHALVSFAGCRAALPQCSAFVWGMSCL